MRKQINKMKKYILILLAVIVSSCTPEELPQPEQKCETVVSYVDEFYPNGFGIQIYGQTVYSRRFYILKDNKTGEIRKEFSFFQFEAVGYVFCNDIN